jgi:hypothetical protein
MKLVIQLAEKQNKVDPVYEGKIYYHDALGNEAKLLIDNVPLFNLVYPEAEWLQTKAEKVEALKKVRNPDFTPFIITGLPEEKKMSKELNELAEMEK